MDFSNRRVLIVGEGISGKGAYEALCNCGAKCSFFSSEMGIEDNVDLVVVSPGVPVDSEVFLQAREKGCPIIGEIEVGYLLCDKPIIAISGTNGKTTITELIGSIISYDNKRALVCGNIGRAFSLAAQKKDFDVAVVEISSFQLETISHFRPTIAIISNITEDHLDRHKTMENYANAKLRIAQNQTSDDYLIVTSSVMPYIDHKKLKPKTICVDMDKECSSLVCRIWNERIYYGQEEIIKVEEIGLKGRHNLSNVLLSITACKLFGIGNNAIRQGLRLYSPRAYRMTLSGEHRGIKYYNDSKGTNIDACLCACRAMEGDTCLILGGSDKGYDFDKLFLSLPKNIVFVFAVGETSKKIILSAKKADYKNIREVTSIKEATIAASQLNVKNILLSPAAASFDSYSSYKERGKDFDNIVGELMQIDAKQWT